MSGCDPSLQASLDRLGENDVLFGAEVRGRASGQKAEVWQTLAHMPGEGFEPPAFGLQNRCSTAELTRLRRSVWFGPSAFRLNAAAAEPAVSA
jgi:hypothetical protein